MPTVIRSEMEAGPSQKVLKVISTIIREGAKTPASLFAMVRLNVSVTSSCENSPTRKKKSPPQALADQVTHESTPSSRREDSSPETVMWSCMCRVPASASLPPKWPRPTRVWAEKRNMRLKKQERSRKFGEVNSLTLWQEGRSRSTYTIAS